MRNHNTHESELSEEGEQQGRDFIATGVWVFLGVRVFCGSTGGKGFLWFQGEGGERVMGRGERRRRRRQQASGEMNRPEIYGEMNEHDICGKKRNGREGLKIKMARIQRRFFAQPP